jgi:hypothetical protein
MHKYKDQQKAERALIGLLVGGAMGLGINFLFLWIFNLVCSWIGRQPVQITWWSVIPFTLIMAFAMAINMANPPFGD